MSEELNNYFKNMFTSIDSNIILDKDQIKAIMNDDKYTLVLAGAGTGKTTTMVGKVKYLVDIKHVDPSKILVISYTKKAVEELQKIINEDFNINTMVTTFHSLAYRYVRELFSNRKCEIVDYNMREKIFYDYVNELFKTRKIDEFVQTFTKEKLEMNYFFLGKFFLENYKYYPDYDSFYKAYKVFKINEARKIGIKKVIGEWVQKRINNDEFVITIKGELVKSAGEATIANFLYTHGIEYYYEQVYPYIMEDNKIYKPDFTLNLAGQPVYIEYFGLDDQHYNKMKMKKIEFHKINNNKFIYFENIALEELEKQLDEKLKLMNFIYHQRTEIEIYNQILDNNKLSQLYKLKNLFFNTIDSIKESLNRNQYLSITKQYIESLDSDEKNNAYKQFEYINNFYIFYSKRLYDAEIYRFDFSDLLYYVNKYFVDKRFLRNIDYDYIIIDEYQDISDGEYALARNTASRGNSKVFAVGDDWQSIYSFRGSNINYITMFNQYFENPTILSIRTTYRNSQELVDLSGDFIRKNKSQIDKKLISFKHLTKPIYFVLYDDRVDNTIDKNMEYIELKKLIMLIHEKEPKHNILILGRNNDMIEQCFKSDVGFIDDLGTKIKIDSIDNLDLEGMTIHKSKGLTFDEVIIIGMNKKFPSEGHSNYWLIKLFEQKLIEESIPYAEERRLLYVALTRTRNNVFVMTNKNQKHRSPFVDELNNIWRKKIEEK